MIKVTAHFTDDTIQELVAKLAMIGKQALPTTARAAEKVSRNLVAGTWKSYAMGAPIPGSPYRVKSAGGGYARSIKVRKRNDMSYEIYSDSPVAGYLEHGTKELDMKTTHPFGRRSRVGKPSKGWESGTPYLIIPFRHGTPTARRNPMPSDFYNSLRAAIREGAFMRSRVNMDKAYMSPNWAGKQQLRMGYNWGSSVLLDQQSMADPVLRRLDGMVVFEQESSNKENRSGYLTFRVISVKSAPHRWIKPATPAKRIAESAARNSAPIAAEIFEHAIKQDLGL